MGHRLPPITVLPGGRKVRDYSSLSPQKAAEQAQDYAGEEEELEPEEEPKPKAKKPKAEMNPWDEFAARIDEPEGTNIYPAMAEQIISPAIVIVAADPWMEDSGFQYDAEHYLAICLAEASAPQDALERIHQMVHAVREAGGEGWDIGDVSGVRQASIPGNDGIKYLGSWVQVTFRSCEHTVEEGS